MKWTWLVMNMTQVWIDLDMFEMTWIKSNQRSKNETWNKDTKTLARPKRYTELRPKQRPMDQAMMAWQWSDGWIEVDEGCETKNFC